MACDFHKDNHYHRLLLNQIKAKGIAARISIIGFLPEEQLANLLAASDAVVLPFRDGAGAWNTSVDGAVTQGVLVITTSLVEIGYNKEKNIYFSQPGNVEEMIMAIEKYAGHHISSKPQTDEWQNIAEQHFHVYKEVVNR